MDPAKVEYRRRIWAYLYHADRSYALVLGRPNAIQDDYTSTLAPLNIDDLNDPEQLRHPRPLSIPTHMTFVILRHSLANIIGRMVHHFQQVKTPSHYSEVLALDDDLMRFVNNLPPHYSFDPDTSLDASQQFVPVHRFLLITEVLFIRISLHRPYILRRLPSDRYLRSRIACFESAIKDSQVRRAFRENMPKEVQDSSSNAYRNFQTAMISGIYLILDPQGRHATVMHDILDHFLTDHQGLREMDETTRREVRTIEFLKSKAEDVYKDREAPAANVDSMGLPMGPMVQRRSYPTINTLKQASGMEPAETSPSASFAGVAQSPTVQRLQGSGSAEYGSPAGSGSPSADDESAAQSLLDNWCNNMNTGPDLLSGVGSNDLSWPASSAVDMSGWGIGSGPAVPSGQPVLADGDGSDWSYWENLVSQIRN